MVHPRSRCPACGELIRWYQNVPIVSWIMLRARCARCGCPISWRYPLVELMTAGILLGLWLTFGPSWAFVVAAPFCLAMTVLFFTDLDLQLLPDAITWPGIVRLLCHSDRIATVERDTKETRIRASVNLDASDDINVSSGIGFYDHMLEQIAKHGGFGLNLSCDGDLEIDEHHTVEDTAICLGSALRKALGNKLGIGRYGFLLPMDESEAKVALDLSGRASFSFAGRFPRDNVGELSTEMVEHFFRSLADSLGAALHIEVSGENTHHMIEACFKSVGRALRQAISRDGTELPSTKGTLS